LDTKGGELAKKLKELEEAKQVHGEEVGLGFVMIMEFDKSDLVLY
jgi:hypothetical protein